MARPLSEAWPSYINGTTPDTGTKITAELLDSIEAAIEGEIYHPDHDESPSDTTEEVVLARDVYATLDARLDAIASAAAGGAAVASAPVVAVNLIKNGDFLIASGGDAVLPDGWALSYGGAGAATVLRVAHNSGAPAGKNMLKVSTASGGYTDLYIDLVTDSEQTDDGKAPLKNAKVAAGIWINADSGYSDVAEVYVQDSNSSLQKVGKQGATTGSWVWSASVDSTLDGGCVLSSSPTRLRFVVRITGAAVVYLQCATLGWGEKATHAVQPDYLAKQLSFGLGAEGPVLVASHAKLKLDQPSYLVEAYGLAIVSGTAVVTFAGCTFTWTASDTAVVTYPSVRSMAKDAVHTFVVTSADTTIRTPLINLRLLQPVDHLRGLFARI